MTGVPALLWLFFHLALVAWVASIVLVKTCMRWFLSPALSPAVRVRRLYFLAIAPWLFPVTVVGAACLSALFKQLGWIVDHCLHHGSDAVHVCFVHWPEVRVSPLTAVVAGLAAAAILLSLLRLVVHEYGSSRRVNTLLRLSRGNSRLRLLDDDEPLALAVGLRRPFVMLSRGLLELLEPRERRAVVAHECAHVRNGDLRHNLLVESALLLHPAWTAVALRQAWRQALEERADDAVAAQFGPDVLARALVKVLRARSSRSSHHAVCSAMGADALQRVSRLLDPPARCSSAALSVEVALACVLLGCAAAVLLLHHVLEHLLAALVAV